MAGIPALLSRWISSAGGDSEQGSCDSNAKQWGGGVCVWGGWLVVVGCVWRGGVEQRGTSVIGASPAAPPHAGGEMKRAQGPHWIPS